jgi:hypothetical protein
MYFVSFSVAAAAPHSTQAALRRKEEHTNDHVQGHMGQGFGLAAGLLAGAGETIGLFWADLLCKAPSGSSAAGPKPCPTIAIAKNEWH